MNERKPAGDVVAWVLVAATLSFIASGLAGVAGIVLTTGWIIIPASHPQLRGLGIVLLLATFPLLICGGHCLDLIDRRRKLRNRQAVAGGCKTSETRPRTAALQDR